MYFIDSHAHLDDAAFSEDIDTVIEHSIAKNILYTITIGQDIQTSNNAVALSQKYDSLFATVGIHPHEAKSAQNESYKQLSELVKENKVVGIGEIGLDYHYDHSPREIQKEVFRKCMSIAEENHLPVVIHTREAEVDTIQILEEFRGRVIGVMHCFSGNKELLENCLHLDYYISIAGPVTFKKATDLQELVKLIPEDRLLIETDCPYLTPVPYRGKRNEPAYVIHVAEKIAELRKLSLGDLAKVTKDNTKHLFKLPIP